MPDIDWTIALLLMQLGVIALQVHLALRSWRYIRRVRLLSLVLQRLVADAWFAENRAKLFAWTAAYGPLKIEITAANTKED